MKVKAIRRQMLQRRQHYETLEDSLLDSLFNKLVHKGAGQVVLVCFV